MELRVQRRQGRAVTVFLCGDVMTGQGHRPGAPAPERPPHPRAVRQRRPASTCGWPRRRTARCHARWSFSYIWGDALDELARVAPDARIINLETSITRSDDHWPGKGIHYRMHPDNVGCLTAAGIDVCALANNHVLDFGHAGLRETLETLTRAGLRTAGAGRSLAEAREPAVVEISGTGPAGRLRASETSRAAFPRAGPRRTTGPGIDLLPDLSEADGAGIVERVQRVKRARDVVVASIHWGSNWGYEVPRGAAALRALAARRRRRHRPRPFLPPCPPDRGLPGQAHPLRLRGFPRRLRRHRRLRGVPRRSDADVLPDGSSPRPAGWRAFG